MDVREEWRLMLMLLLFHHGKITIKERLQVC